MANFERVPGPARQYRNTDTGEIISRRKYLEQKRGVSNEMFAKMNAVTNPELAALRPARGRKSALKLSKTEQELIAQARLEDKLRQREIREEAKKKREIEKLLKKRGTKKQIKRRRITGALLQPGRMGRRIPFETYDDYVEMFKEAKAGGKVKFYGLGMQGYHENTGQELDITVFTMRTLTRPIPEDEFFAVMEEALEERLYFVFTNYWMHLAFSKEYAAQRAAKAKNRKRR